MFTGLHMSDLLHHDDDDDDAIDPDEPNDIDVSRMVPNGTANNDYTIYWDTLNFNNKYDKNYIFDDIFSYNVKEKAMSVPQ